MHALWLLATGFLAATGDGFALGVAAGDVTDTAAVLWTCADTAGMLEWQVAADEEFTTIVRTGQAEASTDADLTVHVDVDGLVPDRVHHYRFIREDEPGTVSAVGRFRTAPPADAAVSLRFAFSGDSDARYVPFDVLRFAADEGLDFFIYLGDIIYGDVPAGELGVAVTLGDYRAKYRQNRTDAWLQGLLASTATWSVWDDHEVTNDYSGLDLAAQGRGDQIAAGYQAFFEHMPIRRTDDLFRTYRSFRFGRTAEFFLLDGRQHREPSASSICGGVLDPLGFLLGNGASDPVCMLALLEPRTMLGAEQLDWLKRGLVESTATVKFVVTNVPMEFFGLFPYDRWDGYDQERRELLEFIDANRLQNVWFITTDFHANAYNPDLMAYFRRERPDYYLPNGVVCPEIITGPIATATLHDEGVLMAEAVLNIDASGPLASALIHQAEACILQQIMDRNDLRFVETNQFSYVVMDVEPDGFVRTRFRGLTPGRRGGAPGIETMHEEPPLPLPLPCGLPFAAALVLVWAAAVASGRPAAWRAMYEGRRHASGRTGCIE